MRGLILAAGFGTRMRPLTEHRLKALLPLCGRPLLERSLALFARHRLGPVAVNSHYLHEQLTAFRSACPHPFLVFHEEDRIRGTGGALWFARDFLGAAESFFVSSVEPVKEPDLAPLIKTFRDSAAACGLVSVPVEAEGTIFGAPGTRDYLGTRADELGGREVERFCYIGVAFYRREALSLLSQEDFSVVPLWHRIQQHGMRTLILPAAPELYWRDIGTPRQLALAHFDAVRGRSPYGIPDGLIRDPRRGSVYPSLLGTTAAGHIAGNVWLESTAVPEGATFQNAVVLAGSLLKPGRAYENTLVTPWGEVEIGQE